MSVNVDPQEIARFDQIAAQWWNPDGDMAPLHVINPVRLSYLKDRCDGLENLQVVDVGCGGGLLSEAMAQAGAKVLGVDLAAEVLGAARHHADGANLALEYREVSAEQLALEQPGQFDLVTCMEMLEHVPDPASVIQACSSLVRPGGDVVFSTLNRNLKSYGLAIVGAEYLLQLIPRGTHDYARFIRPSELEQWARHAGLSVRGLSGLQYNPVLRHARLSRDVSVNYLMHCQRPK